MLLLSDSSSVKIGTNNIYFIHFCRWESWDLSSEMTCGKLQRKSVCQIRRLNYFICREHWINETSISLMFISVSLVFAHNNFRAVIGITLDMYWCVLEWHFGIGEDFFFFNLQSSKFEWHLWISNFCLTVKMRELGPLHPLKILYLQNPHMNTLHFKTSK